MNGLKEEGKATFDITLMRDSLMQFTVTADTSYTLGIIPIANNYPIERISYTLLESFSAGTAFAMDVLKGYVSDFQYVFSSEGAKSVGMFGSIGSLFPATWDWHAFWLMTAFISIVLAFMNILPIPALDGGHVLFLLYEVITRRKPSDKFLEIAQMVGLFLLFGLLIYANANDIVKFFFK